MKKLKIGIDIDNVIAESYPAYLNKYNTLYREEVKMEEVVDFYFLNDLAAQKGQKVADFISLWELEEKFVYNLPPVFSAVSVIKKWVKKGSRIYFVTARPKRVADITKIWLKRHRFWHKGCRLDLFDEKSGQTDVAFKSALAQKYKLEIFIEDNPDIAKGLKIPVLLIDQPWNRGQLPSHIKRVFSWEEIDQRLTAIVKK